MSRRQTWATLAVGLFCGGLLVLFTQAEVGRVRGVNGGPRYTSRAQRSDGCRGSQPRGRERNGHNPVDRAT